jgi:hypothetical protein
MMTDGQKFLEHAAMRSEGGDPELTQGVVVQIEDADLGTVGHSDGEAAPALRGDAGIGA